MSQHNERDGDWLSAKGDYRHLIHGLCSSDPRLRRRDPRAVKHQYLGSTSASRVVLLEAGSESGGSASFGRPLQYNTAQALNEHLENRPTNDIGRVYILEGLHPAFHAVLGDHFGMHPSFFAEHERIDVIPGPFSESDSMVLPTIAASREHVVLKYFELFNLPRKCRDTFLLDCAVTGRHIGATRYLGSFSEIGVLRRKCSIWQRQTKSGKGWDCIIITDPPLTHVKREKSIVIEVPASPYHRGYIDFTPHDTQMQACTGPSRVSLLDDLCFYLCERPRLLNLTTPDSVSTIAQKLVASHYSQLADFLRNSISHIQWRLSRQESLDVFSLVSVEAQWSDIQSLERRTSEYCEDLGAVMIQCGVPFSSDILHANNWADTATDFRYLYTKLKDIRAQVDTLNQAITALTGMAGNRQALEEQERSLQETKSTKALTFLGLVFIPLAYTASLFSMAEPYGPGYARFWLYFAVSLPLILLVLAAYFLMDIWVFRNDEIRQLLNPELALQADRSSAIKWPSGRKKQQNLGK